MPPKSPTLTYTGIDTRFPPTFSAIVPSTLTYTGIDTVFGGPLGPVLLLATLTYTGIDTFTHEQFPVPLQTTLTYTGIDTIPSSGISISLKVRSAYLNLYRD